MNTGKHTKRTWTLLLLLSLAMGVCAQTPHLLSLSGYVTDSNGDPLAAGDVDVAIYGEAAGGSPVWSQSFPGAVSEGVFDVSLGESPALELDNTRLYYYEVAVDGEEVVGDANGGRVAFYPGGGSHTHSHPAEDIAGGSLAVDDIDAAGTVSAAYFAGDGSQLTNLPSSGTSDDVYVNESGDTMSGTLDMGGNGITNIGDSGTDFDSSGGLTTASGITAGGAIKSTVVAGLEVDSTSDAQIIADKNAASDDNGLLLQTDDTLNWMVGTRNSEDFIIRNYFGTETNVLTIDNTSNLVTLAGGLTLAGDMNISKGTPRLYLTDTGQTSPAGRFLILSASDRIRIYGKNATDDGWQTIIDMERIADGGQVYFNGADGLKLENGPLDMDDHPITNIGAAGTDFTSSGGLNLADDLNVQDIVRVLSGDQHDSQGKLELYSSYDYGGGVDTGKSFIETDWLKRLSLRPEQKRAGDGSFSDMAAVIIIGRNDSNQPRLILSFNDGSWHQAELWEDENYNLNLDAEGSILANSDLDLNGYRLLDALSINASGDVCTDLGGGVCLSTTGGGAWVEDAGNIYYLDGRVGVGTASPGVPLEVQGGSDVDLTGVNGNLIVGASATSHMAVDNNEIQAKANPTTAANLILQHGGGNIGVGESNPSEKLEVEGNIIADAGDGHVILRGTDANGGVEVRGENGGSPYIDFANDEGADYDARIQLNGDDAISLMGADVGIGTVSPSEELDVVGDVKLSGTFYGLNTVFFDGGGDQKSDWYLHGDGLSDDANILEVYNAHSGAENLLTLEKGGNVGVGTTSPQAKLDVAGDAQVQGTLTLSGNCDIVGENCVGDIAELMHSVASKEQGVEGEFSSGDVVCADPTDPRRISYCTGAYDGNVLSVVNYQASQYIGDPSAPYPVALKGIVPVNVDCSTPIQAGDLLVASDKQGYAQSMKAKKATTVEELEAKIGTDFAKALQDCESGETTITAWLT